jgi:site-specific DNA recombinase
MGRAMLSVLGVFSQLERDTIAQRTREALRHKQANGGHLGCPPFGYRMNGGGLEPVPEELAIVEKVELMRADGATLRKIAAWLQAERVPTRRRRRWSPEHVRHLLKSARSHHAA